ncbi:sugar transferase [Paenibacillus sp. FSL R7-0337]|uniref:sugar transferase n=1 Tax=Paenibacillus sp. FSL R7-0337 TaxID=1926588 RepID=UPI00096D021E|nr:sugar transferase [Paenibacillus sp. FSL R7-0337]OMF90351.1 UDP-phosphate galactose phosphotransferase [Paenibacillus sp. FSL R7-0337]
MGTYLIIKRTIDIFLALLSLPFIFVIILIMGICIKIEDRGPIFYKSKRVGKNGDLFDMLKIRSMLINAPDIRLHDGSTYNSSDDVRVTKMGRFLRKTSIDELPQIINILFGHMSIVGPRPSTPYWLEICSEEDKEILNLAPGLTGYNQAYYRNSITDKEKYTNDLYYVRNISFKLDFKIFIRTISTILKREKVYKDIAGTEQEGDSAGYH